MSFEEFVKVFEIAKSIKTEARSYAKSLGETMTFFKADRETLMEEFNEWQQEQQQEPQVERRSEEEFINGVKKALAQLER